MNDSVNSRMRDIPSVEVLMEKDEIQDLIYEYPRLFVVEAVRRELAELRISIMSSDEAAFSFSELFSNIKNRLRVNDPVYLKPVINATGVLLHTNLGRAPLSEKALNKVSEFGKYYTNLEYDLNDGERGERFEGLRKMISCCCGAEDALVVNNNAAAVLLVLVALANSKKAIISRGELVQIGGGFRVPEIMETSGVILKEVGTTNQTYLEDYAYSVDEDTGIVLKVNPSNYQMTGFVHETSIKELKILCADKDIPLVYDMGCGTLIDTSKYEMHHELTVQEALSDGADIVCFSGDKLIGGTQAGIIVGKKQLIDKISKHPLMRVVRLDKVSGIILSSVIKDYLDGNVEELPLYKMLKISMKELYSRSQRIVNALLDHGIRAKVVHGESCVGGGTLPSEVIPTCLVSIEYKDVDKMAKKFRLSETPLVGRIENDTFILDLRTVFPEQDDIIISLLTK